MDFTTSALIVSWIAILLLALVVSGLIRQVHQLTRNGPHRPQHAGLRPGSTATGLDGLVEEGHSTVLLFLDPGCASCAAVLSESRAWAARQEPGAPQLRALYAAAAPPDGDSTIPVTQHRPDLFDAYAAIATPYAAVIGPSGRLVRSEPLGSPTALLQLLDDVHPSRTRSGS